MIVYKLTDENMRTNGGYQWALNQRRAIESPDVAADLCTPHWFHCYESPLLAALHNPIHGNFLQPRLFRAEAEEPIKRDRQMKMGCTAMTPLEELPLQEFTLNQRIYYGIQCALAVYSNPILA